MATNQNNSISKALSDSFQQMANISMEAMQPIVENMAENISNINKAVIEGGIPSINILGQKKGQSKCCPPEETCPPHCIAAITREGMVGERIIIPFKVKNSCNSQKTYRVGARELKDTDGNIAPDQPHLNKQSVTLEPGRSERILISLDLGKFKNGTYEAEIVLREKDINQNICLKIIVNDGNPVEVTPYDEKTYKRKWLNWQSHFYCEPQRETGRKEAPVVTLRNS